MNKRSQLSKVFMQLILSKTARHTYLIFIGNGVAIFFAFLFTITAIRLLSVSDFGYFSAIFTFLILVSDLADIGIGNSLSRFLPPLQKEKEKLLSFLKTAFVLQFNIALVIAVAIYFFSPFLSDLFFHTSEYSFLFKIISLGVFATILANFFQYSLSALQKFLYVSVISATGGMLRLLTLIALLPFSLVNLTNVIWSQVVTYIMLVVVAVLFLDLSFISKEKIKGDLRKLLKFTFFLGTARSLTAIVSRLDVLMLVAFTNSVETGIYSYASRVISVYPLFAGSFTTVIAPKFAQISNGELQKFMIKVIAATIALIVSIIILIVFAYPFMTILFGEKTIPAVSVFQLLLFSMIFFVGSVPAVGLAIYYLKKPYILTVNSILQLVIVIIGNFIFIPKYGKYGPAYSLILAYGITFLLTSYLSYHYLRKIR